MYEFILSCFLHSFIKRLLEQNKDSLYSKQKSLSIVHIDIEISKLQLNSGKGVEQVLTVRITKQTCNIYVPTFRSKFRMINICLNFYVLCSVEYMPYYKIFEFPLILTRFRVF